MFDVWITARENGALNEQQAQTADRAYMLIRGFATVGIIALVDEVTGYQEIRDKLALQEILDKYLLDYRATWAKRFPDEFYKEIFRLNKWAYNPTSVRRPSIIGTMTNDMVYSRLAPGILDELRTRTPKDEKGRRKHRYFQRLTKDIGNPALREHIASVIVLMKVSTSWRRFYAMLNRALPRWGSTLPMSLDFKEDEESSNPN